MKAAIVMPLAHQRGGAELMLLHLLRADRENSQVKYTLAFLEEGPLVEEAEALGYQVRVIAVGRLRQLTRYVQGVLALAAWLRRERVGVVMSWMAKAHLYAAPAACLAGTPSVWWQHGVPESHWLDRLATRLPAGAVFCCSNASQQAQQALSPSRPARVIYPAVDLERFDPERLPAPTEARSRIGLPAQVPLVGILARLQRWKGLFVFLEAAARVARVNPEARFVVLGGPHFDEPALHAELVEQAKRTGILGRVYFAGHQDQTGMPLWVQALDVVVNASIEPEPFGMTIIESMALGKAVIATRQGGPLEIIDDGKDGLLIQPGDPAALASSILRLTKDADNRSAIGKEARRRAQQFSTGRLASELAQHLTEVIR
jgi:glycosyltransferase involved in cell wall biosynthesis